MTSPVVSPVLIGRDLELAELRSVYREAITERPCMALVAGEAGIGKSRLVAEFTARIDAEARVYEGHCLSLGIDGLPYAPFVGVLHGIVKELGTDRLTELLPGADGHALAAWLPELGDSPASGEFGRTRLFEELLTLVERLCAERPLVLVLEDLHWSDPSTREMLDFLSRAVKRPGLLLLATYRSTELDDAHPLRALVSELDRRPGGRILAPARLSHHAVGRQLAALRQSEPDTELITRVHRLSEGNPLFVEALAAAPADTTPARLRDLLMFGIAELPQSSRRLLRAASVSESRVGHDLLIAVSGRSAEEVEDALRPIVDRQILVAAPDGYPFRHALIRQAVYEGLLPGERRRWHRRFAELLTTRTDLEDPDRAAYDLAMHWYHADEPERSFTSAWRAAHSANRRYAYEERLRMLDRVLDLWDRMDSPARLLGTARGEVHALAAETCIRSGDSQRGVRHADAALADVDTAGFPARASVILKIRGQLKARLTGDGTSDIAAALTMLPADADPALRAELLAHQSATFISIGDYAAACRSAEASLAVRGGESGHPAAVASLAVAEGVHGDMDRARRLFDRARRIARQSDDDSILLTTYVWQASALTLNAKPHEAAPLARDGLELASRMGLDRSRGPMLAINLANALYLLGDWPRAHEVYEALLDLNPPPLYRFMCLVTLASLLADRGDFTTAAAYDRLAEQLATEFPPTPKYRVDHEVLRLQLACEQRKPVDPEHLASVLSYLAQSESRDGMWWSVLAKVTVMVTSPHTRTTIPRAERGTHVAELRTLAAAPANGGLAQRQRLTTRAALSDSPSQWDEAAEAWRAAGAPYLMARCLLGGGEARLSLKDRKGAQSRLTEAAELAERLGAVVMAQRIARLTADRGPAQPRVSGHGLTPRELDVLRLLTEGRSNKQIAAELYISVSTAGVHVSRILTKLAVASRGEAAALAHREGWFAAGG